MSVASEIARRWTTGEPAGDLLADRPQQSIDATPPFSWLPDPRVRHDAEERRRIAEAKGMRMRARSVTEGTGGWVLVEAIWSLEGDAAPGTAGLVWFALRVAEGRVVEIHALQDREDAEERTGATAPERDA